MIEYCKLFLLVALWSVEVSNTELRCPDTSLDAEADKTVILPCWTVPKMDVGNKVEWVLNDTVDVHLLRNGKPEFDHQGKDYKDRTSLFDSQLGTGNCSLRLKTKMTHTGRYRCSVRIGDETKHCFISLTIRPHEGSNSTPLNLSDSNQLHGTNSPGGGNDSTFPPGGIVGIIVGIIVIIILGVIWKRKMCCKPIQSIEEPNDHNEGEEGIPLEQGHLASL
ncbi:CD276 antigen homolog isoform X2 [Perca fluviatilis]|uniref:CD276 antigen homolog isoform X2 n=1 Tax=Perca fluviatilis TaxID=8168 RepID=UPI0019650626|nr:CD276 antigen homolog isoform X2 [Perca fluviatilis]